MQAAAAMRLTAGQTDDLLTAGGHLPLNALRQQSDSDLLAAFPQVAETTPPFQAISRILYFVGRAPELVQLTAWLVRPFPAPMVLQGMAGVGKTAVAAERYYREGLAAAQQNGREANMVMLLKSVGTLRFLQGDMVGAKRF
ncbi:MAG: hypothetical protein GY796_19885 [Chloroflexi bacterium]|nr:hypothetical protein [Chloroflexota bacterium]